MKYDGLRSLTIVRWLLISEAQPQCTVQRSVNGGEKVPQEAPHTVGNGVRTQQRPGIRAESQSKNQPEGRHRFFIARVAAEFPHRSSPGLHVYKIGITSDPRRRFSNATYGYKQQGFTSMVLLACATPKWAAALETF